MNADRAIQGCTTINAKRKGGDYATQSKLLAAGAAVIVFGLVLLVLTYAAEFLLPLIGFGLLGYLVYQVYKAAKQSGMF